MLALNLLCAAIIAVEVISFLDDPQTEADTALSAQAAPLLDSVVGLLLPLAAAGPLFAAVAAIYRHLRHAAAGAGNRPLGGIFAILCTAAGTLHLFFFFLQPAGGVGAADVGAQARALGLAATRVLPAAAVACFFLGMLLIILGHIRAGGEGGGGAVGAADAQIQGPAWFLFLTKVAFGAAAVLALLIAVALYGATSN